MEFIRPKVGYKEFVAYRRAFADGKAAETYNHALAELGPPSTVTDPTSPLNYGKAAAHRLLPHGATPDEMADAVVAAAKSFVAKAQAGHEARIAALEQQLMQHGRTLDEVAKRLAQLELNAGA